MDHLIINYSNVQTFVKMDCSLWLQFVQNHKNSGLERSQGWINKSTKRDYWTSVDRWRDLSVLGQPFTPTEEQQVTNELATPTQIPVPPSDDVPTPIPIHNDQQSAVTGERLKCLEKPILSISRNAWGSKGISQKTWLNQEFCEIPGILRDLAKCLIIQCA